MSAKILLICVILNLIISNTLTARILHQVVNGTDAQYNEFPFLVSLQRVATGMHLCGATILNRFWVLTAAHCVAFEPRPINVRIEFGSTELENNNSPNLVNVSEIYMHKAFGMPGTKSSYDIGLLMLERPLTFSENVQPVRLPKAQQETAPNEAAVLIGWGLNASDGQFQPRLQKVTLQIFSHDECSRRFRKRKEPLIICAGLPHGSKGQCNGDSGGPLLVNGIQVGIVSRSQKPCAVGPFPGIYTKLSAHIHWIRGTILARASKIM